MFVAVHLKLPHLQAAQHRLVATANLHQTATPTQTPPPRPTLPHPYPHPHPHPLSPRTSQSVAGRLYCSLTPSTPAVPRTPIPGPARQTQITTTTHKKLSRSSTGTSAAHQARTRYRPAHKTTRLILHSRMRISNCWTQGRTRSDTGSRSRGQRPST